MWRLIGIFKKSVADDQSRFHISSSLMYGILAFPFIIVCGFSFLLVIPSTKYLGSWMLQESHPVEWVQFFSLLAASWISYRLAFLIKNRSMGSHFFLYYILLAGVLFIVAMEEVSWGQWLFGIEPPEYFKAENTQRELNIHNMPMFFSLFEIFRLAIGIGGVILILLGQNHYTRIIGTTVILLPWFILIFIMATLDFYNQNVHPHGNIFLLWAFKMVEVLELLIALSALIYVWLNFKMVSSSLKES